VSVEHVELLVEELSAEAALRILLPSVLGEELSFEVYPYSCKEELLARLPERLRGYARWLPPAWRIVVLVDRDDDDCVRLKQRLERMARDAGLRTRSRAGGQPYAVVNRLAIEELEAWFFGDWEAVRAAYPRVPGTISERAGYRDPDGIKGGTWEAFERVLQRAGYFQGGLRKIEAARTVAQQMVHERNRSVSFQALRRALLDLVPA
jgi:hypothetical protein